MALRQSRRVDATTIDYVVNVAAERGGLLTAASGQIASYNTSITPSSVVPIGILLEDIEAQNYLTHPQRYQRNVSDLGSPVGIMTEGECWTDFIDPYAAPHVSAGKVAYLTHSGMLTTFSFAPGVSLTSGVAATSGIVVGRFMSSIDSDGFAKVHINL